MNNEELEKIRQYYKFLKEKAKRIEEIDEQVNTLKYDPEFKEFFKLQYERDQIFKHFLNYGRLDDISLIEQAVDNVGINDPNDIFVCTGTYIKCDNVDIKNIDSKYLVEKDNPNAQFRIYVNIENGIRCKIDISECNHFELVNKVLYPPKEYDSYEYYDDIRVRYFKKAIDNGLESAKQKVIELKNSKYAIPKIF